MSRQLLKCMVVSVKLQETRDSMRKVFGEAWPAKKAKAMPLITAVMERDSCEILVAAQKVARWAMDDGAAVLAAIVLATAVDCIESGEAVAA